MSVVRGAVLAFFLMLASFGMARAGTPGSTPVNPPHMVVGGHLAPSNVGSRHFTFAAADSSGSIPDVTYGAPYFFGTWQPGGNCVNNGTGTAQVPSGPLELTVSEAVTDFENSFISCFGTGCAWTVEDSAPTYPQGTLFAYVADGGNCTGGDDIYGTAYVNNTGDGINNGDGEGDQHSDTTPDTGDPINASTGQQAPYRNRLCRSVFMAYIPPLL